MRMRRLCRKAAVLAVLFLLVFCTGVSSQALEAIDTDREASLTVYFGRENTGFFGVPFRIYRVADVEASAGGVDFTLTGDFARYPVSVNGLDSSGWRALAQTLDSYAVRDGLGPLRTVKTDSGGRAVFEDLTAGLYLVTGERHIDGNSVFTPQPLLVCLPALDEEESGWIYDQEVSCKYESGGRPGDGGDTVRRKVLKIWDDEECSGNRPQEITVQLLKDGEVYDTVTLSEENGWKFTWEKLDADAEWRVTEYRVPDGYTVSVQREGITFVITNTCSPPDQPDSPDEPDEPGEPGEPGGPDEPGQPGSPDEPSHPEEPGEPGGGTPKLPQTGMLWWPVPLLAFGGLLLFLIGWEVNRHDEK